MQIVCQSAEITDFFQLTQMTNCLTQMINQFVAHAVNIFSGRRE